MTAGFVGLHYPRPEHFEEFVERVHRVADWFRSAPGARSVEVWATTDDDAVVSIARFDSEEALRAAFTGARELSEAVFDDRERKPRRIIPLVSR